METIEETIEYGLKGYAESAIQEEKLKLTYLIHEELMATHIESDFDRGYMQGLRYAISVIRRGKK